MALTNVIEQLKTELKTHNKEVERINNAIRLLQGGTYVAAIATKRKVRRMSAETIAKIRASQKKRWAAIKKKTPTPRKGS